MGGRWGQRTREGEGGRGSQGTREGGGILLLESLGKNNLLQMSVVAEYYPIQSCFLVSCPAKTGETTSRNIACIVLLPSSSTYAAISREELNTRISAAYLLFFGLGSCNKTCKVSFDNTQSSVSVQCHLYGFTFRIHTT